VLTKDERPGLLTPRVLVGRILPTALLFAALAALLFLDVDGASDPESSALHHYLRPAEGLRDTGETAEPVNTLATLRIELPPESAAVLQNTRDRALETGLIQQTEEDTARATVVFEGRRMPAEVRIKGDWTDHVSTDQWSLRIRLDEDRILGFRVFSIQAPATVGYLGEWLVLETMRREGVLAPRSTFVNVVINGNEAGIYFLQEHFSKELLESQGRREGPILVWDEDTHWNALLQAGLELPGPYPAQPAFRIDTAEVRAYGERRLSSVESLSRALDAAAEKMRALRALAVANRPTNERLRALQALDDLQGRTIEELVNVDRLACAHALASLFRLEHSLWWHNMRFYHDPVLDRLEPIMFDNMLHLESEPDPVVFRARGFPAQFTKSRAYTNGVFRYLGRFVRPEYLEELLADLGPELERFEPLVQPRSVARIVRRLHSQQEYLRSVVIPADPINFRASYELVEPRRSGAATVPGVTGTIRVEAWSTTRVPVVVAGFRFSNGSVVPAARALVAESSGGTSLEGDGVVLPVDGRPVRFAFALDERLANLETVQQIQRAVREQLSNSGALRLDVEALFRPLASGETTAEVLDFRRFDPAWVAAGGRPEAPSIEEAMAAHAFLDLDPVTGELVVRRGVWDVEGDLVLPQAATLRILAGTTLRFQPAAVLVATGPLFIEGSAEEPVVLEPTHAAWKGIVVLDARARSTWSHVVVRATDAVTRAGWSVTGGVTFYRSPVSLADCTFAGTLAEDALNVFGTDIALERVTFTDCPSDAFDGDFVTGTLSACSFLRGGGDGADFSGSDVRLIDCTFEGLADKAISAGERSRVHVQGGRATDISIGVAAKDGSEVDLVDLVISAASRFALAVYVKKTEYGPASLSAEGA